MQKDRILPKLLRRVGKLEPLVEQLAEAIALLKEENSALGARVQALETEVLKLRGPEIKAAAKQTKAAKSGKA